jgi:hypothetical protein
MDVAGIYTQRLLSMPLTNGEFFIGESINIMDKKVHYCVIVIEHLYLNWECDDCMGTAIENARARVSEPDCCRFFVFIVPGTTKEKSYQIQLAGPEKEGSHLIAILDPKKNHNHDK